MKGSGIRGSAFALIELGFHKKTGNFIFRLCVDCVKLVVCEEAHYNKIFHLVNQMCGLLFIFCMQVPYLAYGKAVIVVLIAGRR
jgi:hypothetical protein